MADDDKQTLGQAIGYPGSAPAKKGESMWAAMKRRASSWLGSDDASKQVQAKESPRPSTSPDQEK